MPSRRANPRILRSTRRSLPWDDGRRSAGAVHRGHPHSVLVVHGERASGRAEPAEQPHAGHDGRACLVQSVPAEQLRRIPFSVDVLQPAQAVRCDRHRDPDAGVRRAKYGISDTFVDLGNLADVLAVTWPAGWPLTETSKHQGQRDPDADTGERSVQCDDHASRVAVARSDDRGSFRPRSPRSPAQARNRLSRSRDSSEPVNLHGSCAAK